MRGLHTLSKPYIFIAPHDSIPPAPSQYRKFSPKAERDSLPPIPSGVKDKMSTQHRGLPPPAAMSLPDPGRIPPPMAASFTGMPAPPASEESLRSWLVTKAEEEKRKAEEERTRQEGLRLEQRKIEQNILQESIRNGVPPPLVPVIFAGIGGHNLAGLSLEWLQQYNAQLQAAQQQIAAQSQAQTSPDIRRDSRLLGQGQPPTYGAPSISQQILPGGQPPQGQPPPQYGSYPSGVTSPSSGTRQAPGGAAGPTSAPRPPLQNVLPRLTTNEIQIQPIPSAQGVQAGQSHAAQQEQTTSSPSIYFHHWVPPTSQAGSGNPPATPSDYTSSPKKRKATGAHHPAPIPTSAPQTSPSFSHISSSASTPARRAFHGRTRSDASTRASDAPGRPATSSSKAESHSHSESEQERQRRQLQQQQQRGGGGEDRSDSGGSQHGGTSGRRSRHAAGSERSSAPVSPKREGGDTTDNHRSSFGASRPP